nr:MAG TPA: Transcription initiation factor IIE, alpha FINGER, Transcription [Caudoviricetes sp.]
MLQVEKHGTAPRRKAVCFQCGCVFTYTEADEETDRENGKQYITCPDCGKRFRTPPVKSESQEFV